MDFEPGQVYRCLCTIGDEIAVRPLLLHDGHLIIGIEWEEVPGGMRVLSHMEIARERLKETLGAGEAHWVCEDPLSLPSYLRN
jgi:hypothetical protein